MGQKVLVIGSGAREHAIAHALLRGDSVSEVTVASGNPGMELDGIRTTQINESNHAAFISFMQHNQYDWAFVGPEVPLIEGLVDDFAAAGIDQIGGRLHIRKLFCTDEMAGCIAARQMQGEKIGQGDDLLQISGERTVFGLAGAGDVAVVADDIHVQTKGSHFSYLASDISHTDNSERFALDIHPVHGPDLTGFPVLHAIVVPDGFFCEH